MKRVQQLFSQAFTRLCCMTHSRIKADPGADREGTRSVSGAAGTAVCSGAAEICGAAGGAAPADDGVQDADFEVVDDDNK